jgi:hypothetical protein
MIAENTVSKISFVYNDTQYSIDIQEQKYYKHFLVGFMLLGFIDSFASYI